MEFYFGKERFNQNGRDILVLDSGLEGHAPGVHHQHLHPSMRNILEVLPKYSTRFIGRRDATYSSHSQLASVGLNRYSILRRLDPSSIPAQR